MYPDTKFDYIHCMHNNIHLIILLAICIISHVAAEPIPVRQADQIDLLNFDPPQIFQKQMVIRVRTTSQAQLDAMLELVESVWTENTGVGVLDVQIKRSNLNAITKLGIPFDILIDDLQAHTDRGWSQIIEAERLNQDSGPRGGLLHDDLWFANYKQLNEITSYIDNIAALRPELASTAIIGQSWEGRDMFAITISGPDTPENRQADRPVVFIFSTVHAREWIAPMTTVYYASKLVEDYDTDPRVQALLDSVRIVIVPMGNPDGYLFTWSDYRYWRKNRRDNLNSSSFGVDINRNWGYEWGGQGSSGSSSSDTYRGTAPFSEPETATLRDFALSFGDQLIAHMEYHSYSQLVMYPFGYSTFPPPEPDLTYFGLLSGELSDEIKSVHNKNYDPIQAANLYPHAGNSPDWFYGELNVTSFLIELRPRNADFNPPPSNILPNAQENYQAIKRYIQRAVEPVSFWHVPVTAVQSDTATPIRVTILEDIAAVQPSSATLFTRIGAQGQFEPISMSPTGIADFTAQLPPVPCGQTIEYYFQTTLANGNTHTYPSGGAGSPMSAQASQLVVAHFDDLESDTGWIVGDESDTATGGIWTRMDPEATSAQPENDHTPYGSLCWVTDGNAGTDPDDGDVDGGETTLTSPTLDASGLGDDAYINFWLWYADSNSFEDSLRVDLSNDDGDSWTIYGYFITSTDQQWVNIVIPITYLLEPTNQMRVRFIADDRFPDNTLEIAIDDFSIDFFGCPSLNPADINGDGTLNTLDIFAFLSAFSAQDPIADFNNDGRWNFFDISAFLTAYADG